MRTYRFLREALHEYNAAIKYYEAAQSGLGETFVRQIERVIELVMEVPHMGSPVADTPPELEIRRWILRRFSVELTTPSWVTRWS